MPSRMCTCSCDEPSHDDDAAHGHTECLTTWCECRRFVLATPVRKYRLYKQHRAGAREFIRTIEAANIDQFFTEANQYRGNLRPDWRLTFQTLKDPS